MSVVGRRQMKNAKKHSSSADEMQNLQKTARPRPRMSRKSKKMANRGLG